MESTRSVGDVKVKLTYGFEPATVDPRRIPEILDVGDGSIVSVYQEGLVPENMGPFLEAKYEG